MRSRLLAVIPAYNEEAAIRTVVTKTRDQVSEVLVVDDGSSDATARIAGEAGATVLSHPYNLGKATALQTGFDFALRQRFGLVVMLDADGQHDPEEIPTLVGALRAERAQLVAGNRMVTSGMMPISRRIVNGLTARIARLVTGQELPDCHCGFRLVDIEVLRVVRLQSRRFAGDPELLVWAALRAFRITSVPIRSIYNGERSQIEPIADGARLLALAVRAVIERTRLGWAR